MARRGENIRKRRDGRWEGRYTQHINGEKKKKSVYARTYKDIKKKLEQAKMLVEHIDEVENKVDQEECQKMTISELIKRWLENVHQHKKYSTYIKYRNICNKYILPTIGKLTLYNLSQTDIYNSLPEDCSESMQKSISSVFNQIMFYGSERYGMKIIHLNKKKQVQKKESVKSLNTSEQKQLLRFLYQDMDSSKLGIVLCLSTGLRLGEICALQWKDIDLEAGVLHVNRTVQRISFESETAKTKLMEGEPKTACSKREIPLSNHILKILKEYSQDSKYVINNKKPMEPRTYQKRFHAYLKSAGISDTHFHTLRHTFATNCIGAGADVKSVSEMLGHSTVSITLNRYVHPSMDTKRNHLNSLDSIYGQYLGQAS